MSAVWFLIKPFIMRKYVIILTVVLTYFGAFAQDSFLDSLSNIMLEEVVIISNPTDKHLKESKALGSLDSYLEKSPSVNMVKRGAYAWEPMLNGMATERSVITLDGMRIYGACTDKMDPITSYVEISNLSKANINSGQAGSQHGGTIAGSIDLVRRKTGFGGSGFGGAAFTGFEGNNEQKIIGTAVHYSKERFFTDVDFTYRDAENYKAGNNREILYSQFTKYNISAISGYKFNNKQHIEASVIFDEATDVGYPALPMDVSLAQAFIGSLQYNYQDISDRIALWETKVYYNTITHIMDDSPRPNVPIRMDMPGWSKTFGMYSKLKGNYNKHQLVATLSAHHNNSLAEMTMYPNNPNENQMYMITWPDVNTLYSGIHLEDNIALNHCFHLRLSAGMGFHQNSIESDFGLQSLRIFYPNMDATQSRILKNVASQLVYQHKSWTHSVGLGYGERAPSVSEGYGFYLFNSFDAFDYVGNPYLKNEKSVEASLSSEFKNEKITVKWQGSYFRIQDYIIGKPDESLIPMTIGANGIKVYEGLDYANLLNTDIALEYFVTNDWKVSMKASYRYGEDNHHNRLPLIQPFQYGFGLRYRKNNFFAEATLDGSAKHSRYSAEFGETPKADYMIANVAVSQTVYINKYKMVFKLGVENMLDTYYTTFSDWNNIPRTGRNIFGNVAFGW
jgi:iron complex outermembrane receptor protein